MANDDLNKSWCSNQSEGNPGSEQSMNKQNDEENNKYAQSYEGIDVQSETWQDESTGSMGSQRAGIITSNVKEDSAPRSDSYSGSNFSSDSGSGSNSSSSSSSNSSSNSGSDYNAASGSSSSSNSNSDYNSSGSASGSESNSGASCDRNQYGQSREEMEQIKEDQKMIRSGYEEEKSPENPGTKPLYESHKEPGQQYYNDRKDSHKERDMDDPMSRSKDY